MARPLRTYKSAVSGYNEFSLWKSEKGRISYGYRRSKKDQSGQWVNEKIWFEPAEIFHFAAVVKQMIDDGNFAANQDTRTESPQPVDAAPAATPEPQQMELDDESIPF